jgi:hypothetical protein
MSAKEESGDKPQPERKPSAPDAGPTDPSKLTKEEQMALYEKELKETDWGHQPC